jgi:hypothetical protein
MDLTAGNCGGEFNHYDGVRSGAGMVTATVGRAERTVIRRVIGRSAASSERWIVTPYDSICAEGREGGELAAGG